MTVSRRAFGTGHRRRHARRQECARCIGHRKAAQMPVCATQTSPHCSHRPIPIARSNCYEILRIAICAGRGAPWPSPCIQPSWIRMRLAITLKPLASPCSYRPTPTVPYSPPQHRSSCASSTIAIFSHLSLLSLCPTSWKTAQLPLLLLLLLLLPTWLSDPVTE